MLVPLQLPSVNHNPSCDGCARDAEEDIMGKEFFFRKKYSQGKTELICTIQ